LRAYASLTDIVLKEYGQAQSCTFNGLWKDVQTQQIQAQCGHEHQHFRCARMGTDPD